ncbi:MAG: HAMP domain-containing sensor histidine kinase [Novosphingobium sp.]
MTGGAVLARATSDGEDRLLSADEPLAGLQLRCGGDLPGTIAIPALLETVRKARRFGLKLARPINAQDGNEAVTAWIEVEPGKERHSGCAITVRNWRTAPLPPEDPDAALRRRTDIDRTLAELTARLDARQCLLAVESDAADLAQLLGAMRGHAGQPWTDFVTIEGDGHKQPMHWRLLDGAEIRIEGSHRRWKAALVPVDVPGAEPSGFELYLVPDAPLPEPERPRGAPAAPGNRLVGNDLAPVLRQPIARIIATAETIRTRMAGPLDDAYSAYAADISSAGQHLLALIDDMADLEVVEADGFSTVPDPIDLADVARQAAGILGVKARERGIDIDAPRLGETLPASAEFRRVLQVLLNLLGNAIRYTPENSQVWIRLEREGDRARVIVADQGAGLTPEQQGRVFEQFERLGRSGDGGSGLGLYISRRLARAMGGDLTVESAAGQGARFILEVPAQA